MLTMLFSSLLLLHSLLPLSWTVGMLGTLTGSVEDAHIMLVSSLSQVAPSINLYATQKVQVFAFFNVHFKKECSYNNMPF